LSTTKKVIGIGIGWRPELAIAIDRDPSLQFIEITAEHYPKGVVPPALDRLVEQGRTIIPHGISVSLGSAEGFDLAAVHRLNALARRFNSPFVSEHVAFVRAGDLEAGHLLPLPRTKAAMQVVIENIQRAQEVLSVPLALENISALFAWPSADFSDAEFLTEILERTNTRLLLDTSNVYANAVNLGENPSEFLDNIPLNRLAYVHVGGGFEKDGVYHDSHAHPVSDAALSIVTALCERIESPGVLLERDDHFPSDAELREELTRIRAAIGCGQARRRGAA
jgi:uncharacterized protein (UPF0276 family)